ncbi:MAG: hypothetical protein R3B47_00845 [Bacteroidia bacterium]
MRIAQSLQAITEQHPTTAPLLTELYPVGQPLEEWLQTTNLVDIEPFLSLPDLLFPQAKLPPYYPCSPWSEALGDAIDIQPRRRAAVDVSLER